MHIVHVMASSQMGGGAKYLELLLPELLKRKLQSHRDNLTWRRAVLSAFEHWVSRCEHRST